MRPVDPIRAGGTEWANRGLLTATGSVRNEQSCATNGVSTIDRDDCAVDIAGIV
jgi:hypothetical protein